MAEQRPLEERYREYSTEVLLDIVEGRDLGYRDDAVIAARRVLDHRGVSFEPVSLEELRQQAEERQSQTTRPDFVGALASKIDRKTVGSWSGYILGLGICALMFPVLGLSSRVELIAGEGFVAVGVILTLLGWVGVLLTRQPTAVDIPPSTASTASVRGSAGAPDKVATDSEDWASVATTLTRIIVGIAVVYGIIFLISQVMADSWSG